MVAAASSDQRLDVLDHVPYTRAAIAMMPRRNDARGGDVYSADHRGGLPTSTASSLSYLRERQLLRSLSGSRRASFDLNPAYPVPVEEHAAVPLIYNVVRISRADAPPVSRRLTAARRLTDGSTSLPRVDTETPHVYDEIGVACTSALSEERLQELAPQRVTRSSLALGAATRSSPASAPARSCSLSSASYPECCKESGSVGFVAFRRSRDAPSSRYSSVESSSSDGEAQDYPALADPGRVDRPSLVIDPFHILNESPHSGTGSLHSRRELSHSQSGSPHSLTSRGSHRYQLPSSSSDVSSAYDGPASQPDSPISVLQSSIAYRLRSAFGSSPNPRSVKSVYSRQAAPAGLENLGNTCFANSVLQCLRAVPDLKAAISAAAAAVAVGRAGPVTAELARLLDAMDRAPLRGVLSPERLLEALAERDERWWPVEQQDAQEFLQALLEALQEEWGPPPSAALYRELSGRGDEAQQATSAWAASKAGWPSTPLGALLGGQLQSTVTCAVCNTASHCFDRFTDLSLPIPHSRAGHVTLQGCLSAFTAVESMPAADGFRCSGCRCKQPAIKRLALRRCPPLLVLSIKRFASTCMAGGFASCKKDSAAVRLPPDALDLADNCALMISAAERSSESPIYDLMGVVSHAGSIDGGHYTAKVRAAATPAEASKGLLSERWYQCSDEVTDVADPPGTEASRQAYLLLYVRRKT